MSNQNNFNNLLNIDGIGDTQINSLKEFFSNSNNKIVLEQLKRY